jgi:hypothetical protein
MRPYQTREAEGGPGTFKLVASTRRLRVAAAYKPRMSPLSKAEGQTLLAFFALHLLWNFCKAFMDARSALSAQWLR